MAHRLALELAPQLGDGLLQVASGLREAHEDHATVVARRLAAHPAVALEALQHLGHRRCIEAEALDEVALRATVAVPELQEKQLLAGRQAELAQQVSADRLVHARYAKHGVDRGPGVFGKRRGVRPVLAGQRPRRGGRRVAGAVERIVARAHGLSLPEMFGEPTTGYSLADQVVATEEPFMAWTTDPQHTDFAFAVRHMVVSTVRGRFDDVAIDADIDDDDLTRSAGTVTVKTGSVNTREAQRDAHLSSPDFFDAEKYPELTFVVTRIEGGDGAYTITGDLTIKDITREIALDAEITGPVTDPWGDLRIGLSATGKSIARSSA